MCLRLVNIVGAQSHGLLGLIAALGANIMSMQALELLLSFEALSPDEARMVVQFWRGEEERTDEGPWVLDPLKKHKVDRKAVSPILDSILALKSPEKRSVTTVSVINELEAHGEATFALMRRHLKKITVRGELAVFENLGGSFLKVKADSTSWDLPSGKPTQLVLWSGVPVTVLWDGTSVSLTLPKDVQFSNKSSDLEEEDVVRIPFVVRGDKGVTVIVTDKDKTAREFSMWDNRGDKPNMTHPAILKSQEPVDISSASLHAENGSVFVTISVEGTTIELRDYAQETPVPGDDIEDVFVLGGIDTSIPGEPAALVGNFGTKAGNYSFAWTAYRKGILGHILGAGPKMAAVMIDVYLGTDREKASAILKQAMEKASAEGDVLDKLGAVQKKERFLEIVREVIKEGKAAQSAGDEIARIVKAMRASTTPFAGGYADIIERYLNGETLLPEATWQADGVTTPGITGSLNVWSALLIAARIAARYRFKGEKDLGLLAVMSYLSEGSELGLKHLVGLLAGDLPGEDSGNLTKAKSILDEAAELRQQEAESALRLAPKRSHLETWAKSLLAEIKGVPKAVAIEDPAQDAEGEDNAAAVGGIDIQNINVAKTGDGNAIGFDAAALQNMVNKGFDGLTPVFLGITPLESPLMAMGVK